MWARRLTDVEADAEAAPSDDFHAGALHYAAQAIRRKGDCARAHDARLVLERVVVVEKLNVHACLLQGPLDLLKLTVRTRHSIAECVKRAPGLHAR